MESKMESKIVLMGFFSECSKTEALCNGKHGRACFVCLKKRPRRAWGYAAGHSWGEHGGSKGGEDPGSCPGGELVEGG